MILILSVLLTLICILYYCSVKNFNYWKKRNVKGPKPIPFFGNYIETALRRKHPGMLYYDIYKQFPEEKVVGIYRMTSPTLLIRDLDLIKQVLIKDFALFPDRGLTFSKRGLGQNIFHCDSKTWPALRNKFTALYTTSKLKNLFHIYAEHCDRFLNYMGDITAKQPEQDIYQQVLKYTVGTAMATEFGVQIDTINDNIKLFELVDENLVTNHCGELEMLFSGSLQKCDLSIIPQKTIEFCHEVIKASINQLNTKVSPSNLVDALMNIKKENATYIAQQDVGDKKQSIVDITETLMAAQAWIFYVAGYANNTLALTYALYHLAYNPDVQNKLIEEIDQVMERHDNKLTYEALKEMKYVDMVFEETLRLHPPTNGLLRGTAKSLQIEGLDFTVDEGTIIVISPYSIQHDEKYYPDPEKFDPERFLPENSKDRHPCAFLTFGVGRRSCLGSQLARIQFAVCITKFFLKFRVETTENTITKIKYNPWRLLMTSVERIRLKVVQRSAY